MLCVCQHSFCQPFKVSISTPAARLALVTAVFLHVDTSGVGGTPFLYRPPGLSFVRPAVQQEPLSATRFRSDSTRRLAVMGSMDRH